LANLEMQAGMIPPADAGTKTTVPPSTGIVSHTATTVTAAGMGLSAPQINALKSTLQTLTVTLSALDTSVAANTTLTPSQVTAVQTTLNGMKTTLVAMTNIIANGGNAPAASAPVAVNAPSTATAPSMAPTVAQIPATAPVTAQATPVANAVPETAQASSIWGFTKDHWPTIVIILLVIAILAILFWPEKESAKTVPTGTSGSGKPKSAPTPIVTASQSQDAASVRPMMSNAIPTPPATPVANAVAAPSQK